MYHNTKKFFPPWNGYDEDFCFIPPMEGTPLVNSDLAWVDETTSTFQVVPHTLLETFSGSPPPPPTTRGGYSYWGPSRGDRVASEELWFSGLVVSIFIPACVICDAWWASLDWPPSMGDCSWDCGMYPGANALKPKFGGGYLQKPELYKNTFERYFN